MASGRISRQLWAASAAGIQQGLPRQAGRDISVAI